MATYYFSTALGNDSNTSTQAQNTATPWKTISKFNSFFSSLNAGDSALFNRGEIFPGAMVPSKNGASGNPIHVGSYGSGAKPIVTGFTTVNNANWLTTSFTGVYKVSIGSLATCNVVAMDGIYQLMGKLPRGNSGYYNVTSASGTDPNWTITGSSSSGVNANFSTSTHPNITASGGIQAGEVCYRPRHWVLWRGRVTAQTSNSISFAALASTLGGGSYSPTLESANFGFFLQNHPSLCTQLGDWSYDSDAHILYMYFGASGPGSHVVQVPTSADLVTASTRSFVLFDNIAFRGAENALFNLVNSPNITIQNCDLFGSGLYGVFANGSSSNLVFTNNNMSYISSIGIRASSSANAFTITGNTFDHIAAVSGMGSSGEGTYWTILNVRNGSNVSNNRITNIGFNGITFQGTNNTVKNNYIDTYCMCKDDAAAIYCGGQSFTGSVIDGNICINGIGAPAGTAHQSDARAHGIYVDDGGSNVEIKNNTCARNGNAGINLHSSFNINMHDNTLFDNFQNGVKYYNGAPSTDLMGTLTFSSNVVFAKTTSEICIVSSGGSSSTASWFSAADNNFWCRPLLETTLFQTPQGNFNLAGWKTFTGKEAHSVGSPIPLTDVNKIRFEYNDTFVSKAVTLPGTFIDVRNVTYDGGITLLPFASAVLLQTSSTSNTPPTANAGIDKNITLPINTVTMGGSGADGDGSISSYAWTKISGPATFSIITPTAASTQINNLVAGTYVFQLLVTDNAAGTGTDTATVVVNPAANVPPTANAGADKAITLPVNSVTLNGSGTDTDGTINAYQWTKTAGPATFSIVTPTAASTSVANLVAGTYTFQLQVTDNSAATAVDSVNVVVSAAPNQPPTANAGIDQTITLPTTTVNLVGTGNDSDGTIASYLWTKLSGPTSITITTPTVASTSVTALVAGTYVLQLKVTDNQGATATDSITITVNPATPPANQPPIANAGTDQTITLPTSSVTVNGSSSFDTDGSITTYAWTKVSGPTGGTITSAASVSTGITALVAGTYVYRLTVTDDDLATASDTLTITVNPAPPANVAPTAHAGVDQSITLPTSTATLSGTATDTDGSISAYSWTKISGPGSGAITSPNNNVTGLTALVQGVYVFRLTATDDDGATGTDDITVTVNAEPPVTGTVQAEAATSKNTTLETTSDTGGGQDMIFQKSGKYAIYSVVIPTSGNYTFTFRVAAQFSGAQFQIRKTNFFGTVYGTVTVPVTGGGQVWTNTTKTIKLNAGTQNIRLYSTKNVTWSLNYFSFVKV